MHHIAGALTLNATGSNGGRTSVLETPSKCVVVVRGVAACRRRGRFCCCCCCCCVVVVVVVVIVVVVASLVARTLSLTGVIRDTLFCAWFLGWQAWWLLTSLRKLAMCLSSCARLQNNANARVSRSNTHLFRLLILEQQSKGWK